MAMLITISILASWGAVAYCSYELTKLKYEDERRKLKELLRYFYVQYQIGKVDESLLQEVDKAIGFWEGFRK